jgi:hypothetical protein
MEEGSVRMSERYMVHTITDSLRDRLSSSSRTSTRCLWIGRTAMSNHGGYRDDHRNQAGRWCWTMAPMNRPEGTCRTMGQAQEGAGDGAGCRQPFCSALFFLCCRCHKPPGRGMTSLEVWHVTHSLHANATSTWTAARRPAGRHTTFLSCRGVWCHGCTCLLLQNSGELRTHI